MDMHIYVHAYICKYLYAYARVHKHEALQNIALQKHSNWTHLGD